MKQSFYFGKIMYFRSLNTKVNCPNDDFECNGCIGERITCECAKLKIGTNFTVSVRNIINT